MTNLPKAIQLAPDSVVKQQQFIGGLTTFRELLVQVEKKIAKSRKTDSKDDQTSSHSTPLGGRTIGTSLNGTWVALSLVLTHSKNEPALFKDTVAYVLSEFSKLSDNPQGINNQNVISYQQFLSLWLNSIPPNKLRSLKVHLQAFEKSSAKALGNIDNLGSALKIYCILLLSKDLEAQRRAFDALRKAFDETRKAFFCSLIEGFLFPLFKQQSNGTQYPVLLITYYITCINDVAWLNKFIKQFLLKEIINFLTSLKVASLSNTVKTLIKELKSICNSNLNDYNQISEKLKSLEDNVIKEITGPVTNNNNQNNAAHIGIFSMNSRYVAFCLCRTLLKECELQLKKLNCGL